MSRLNLNSIFSWVDSHIIDYPTVMNPNYNYFFLLVLLLLFSPVHAIFWLILSTVYFIYNKKYKNISFICIGFFFTWYLIFMVYMFNFDGPIVIKPNFFGDGFMEVLPLFSYIDDRYFHFSFSFYETEHLDVPFYCFSPSNYFKAKLSFLCEQTLALLCIISNSLGVCIYVPSLFKGLFFLFELIFGGSSGSSAECSPEKDKEKGQSYNCPPSPSSPFPSSENHWGSKPNWNTPPSEEKKQEFLFGPPTPKSMFKSIFGKSAKDRLVSGDECKNLGNILHRNQKFTDMCNKESCVVEGYKYIYTEFGPFFNKIRSCSILKASSRDIEEARIFRESEKSIRDKKSG